MTRCYKGKSSAVWDGFALTPNSGMIPLRFLCMAFTKQRRRRIFTTDCFCVHSNAHRYDNAQHHSTTALWSAKHWPVSDHWPPPPPLQPHYHCFAVERTPHCHSGVGTSRSLLMWATRWHCGFARWTYVSTRQMTAAGAGQWSFRARQFSGEWSTHCPDERRRAWLAWHGATKAAQVKAICLHQNESLMAAVRRQHCRARRLMPILRIAVYTIAQLY